MGVRRTRKPFSKNAARTSWSALTQKINHAANINTWLVDYGYSTTETFGHDELKPITGNASENVLRLEPLIEQLIIQSPNYEAFLDVYTDILQNLRGKGYVSLKSIIAYRGGLQLGESEPDQVKGAFGTLKERATRDGKLRVDSKPLLDFLIPRA